MEEKGRWSVEMQTEHVWRRKGEGERRGEESAE